MQNQKKVQKCALILKSKLPQSFLPRVGLVLGTGLGGFAEAVREKTRVSYDELPGFPLSTVASHQGAFMAGRAGGVPVILQQGRCHLYEGRSPEEVCAGVRIMGMLGIRALILTNAAGAVNPRFRAGDLMLIEDQINLTGRSPLTGAGGVWPEPRFPDLSRLYDSALGGALAEAAQDCGIRLERGVYCAVHGPEMETRAEIRAFRLLGGDAVGMSTALEAIAAAHMGIRLAGVSCLTNKTPPDETGEASLENIIATARKAGGALQTLLEAALPRIDRMLAGAVRP